MDKIMYLAIYVCYALIISLIVILFLKSPLVKYWKNIAIGFVFTIISIPIGRCYEVCSSSYGFPMRFFTYYNLEKAYFYETINFDLAFFIANILFWTLMVHFSIRVYKKVI